MARPVDRFLTTHTGSLPRPEALIQVMFAQEEGTPVVPEALDARIGEAVTEVVRRQVDAGIDIVNDGEMSKPSYATYIKDRLNGFGGESRPPPYPDLIPFPGLQQRVYSDRGRSRRTMPGCDGPVSVRDPAAVLALTAGRISPESLMDRTPRLDLKTTAVRGRAAVGAVVLAGMLGAGCGGNPSPRVPPASAPAVAVPSVAGLYDAGRYEEVVQAVGTAPSGEEFAKETWLAALSNVKLNREENARAQFTRLAAGEDPAWRLVGQLAIATMNGETAEIDRVRGLAEASTHPIVQFEVGLSHMRRNEFAAAAQAFDRCIAGDPAFAYAYYYAGLAYQRIDRADLTATRLESFSRLAPRAPERPAVESILRTIRGL